MNNEQFDNSSFQVRFKGWTDFDNTDFRDFSDTIMTLEGTKKKVLIDCMQSAKSLLKAKLKETGICYDGNYHQNGIYGTPVFEVTGLLGELAECNGFYKWTCTFRYWGGLMQDCGFGSDYTYWAWMTPDYEKRKTPDEVAGENLLTPEAGYMAAAYDPEFDVPLG